MSTIACVRGPMEEQSGSSTDESSPAHQFSGSLSVRADLSSGFPQKDRQGFCDIKVLQKWIRDYQKLAILDPRPRSARTDDDDDSSGLGCMVNHILWRILMYQEQAYGTRANATMLDIARRPPTYGGIEDELRLRTWLSVVDNYLVLCSMDARLKAFAASLFLADLAWMWWDTNSERLMNMSWEEFGEEVIKQFEQLEIARKNRNNTVQTGPSRDYTHRFNACAMQIVDTGDEARNARVVPRETRRKRVRRRRPKVYLEVWRFAVHEDQLGKVTTRRPRRLRHRR